MQRSITLFTAVPYLSKWLNEHPRKNDPRAPLWCNLQPGEDISYQIARKGVREAARRAGIFQPVNFTNFIASSASYLASHGMNQAVLEAYTGGKLGVPSPLGTLLSSAKPTTGRSRGYIVPTYQRKNWNQSPP